MPLSEDEQRILQQIERNFYKDNPRSARRIEETTLPRYLRRNMGWGLVGFVVGLAILFGAFASNWVVGVVGFIVMTVSAFVVVQNLRRIGAHGLKTITEELGQRSLGDRLSAAAKRWRHRSDD